MRLTRASEYAIGCSVNKVWMRARDQLRETLGQVTFDQLTKEGACIPTQPPASIK